MNLEKSTDAGPAPGVAIVRLIHAGRGHMSARQRAAGAERVLARLGWSSSVRPERAAMRWLFWAFALVAVCVASFFALHRSRQAALAYAVNGGHMDGTGAIASDSTEQPRLHFSDGTEMVLMPGAKASLRSVDAHGAHLSLAEGTAHIDVMHLPDARWFVDAGPFLVAVTGTAFRVSWSPVAEVLDLVMERGNVEVTGPLCDGAILLRSGQRLLVRVRQRDTTILDVDAQAAADSNLSVTEPAAANHDEVPTPAPLALQLRSTARSAPRANQAASGQAAAPHHWAAQLAGGDFESIVRQAEQMGLDTCLAESSSADLDALADAARFGRHDQVARRALLEQRRRFSQSAPARDAAFLLGRLDETEQNVLRALQWYDRYLAESPAGTYASEALGRKMNLTKSLYGDASVREVAEEYTRRFPQGAYAAQARALGAAP